jgi:hypothetical protein
MSKFKVGDRVAVYDRTGIFYGFVANVLSNDFLDVTGLEWFVHPKQCRKLVPKKKAPRGKIGGRVVWIIDDCVKRAYEKRVTFCDLSAKKEAVSDIKFIEAEDQSE